MWLFSAAVWIRSRELWDFRHCRAGNAVGIGTVIQHVQTTECIMLGFAWPTVV